MGGRALRCAADHPPARRQGARCRGGAVALAGVCKLRNAACPISTRGGTRLVRLVRGGGGGVAGGDDSHRTKNHADVRRCQPASEEPGALAYLEKEHLVRARLYWILHAIYTHAPSDGCPAHRAGLHSRRTVLAQADVPTWQQNYRRHPLTADHAQSQITERKTGDGRGPGDHSSEAG